MDEQNIYQASTDWLSSAVQALGGAGIDVIAPVQNESGMMELARVSSATAIVLDLASASFPLKRMFLPISEVLMDYEKDEDGQVNVQSNGHAAGKETVLLGCRPCDAAALDILDQVFEWDYRDAPYCSRRKRTTVVSFACTEPGPNCFCTSVGGSPHGNRTSDVVVFPNGDNGVLLQVHTEGGKKFIERLGDTLQPAPAGTELPSPPELKHKFEPEKVKVWLDGNFDSDFWLDDSLSCLGCGSCSFLCPTCHCFDIVDEGTWNRGQRRRNWDCCSFDLFTQHSSGHNPRPNRASRHRQRLMHKFKYFPERFGMVGCVGCGRCMKNCGVGQDLVESLQKIQAR